MAANADTEQPFQRDRAVLKDIVDGAIALAAIAGGPAILFLGTGPLVGYVPGLSAHTTVWWLAVGAVAIPMLPALSFILALRPQKNWKAGRIVASLLVFVLSIGINASAIVWKARVDNFEKEAAKRAIEKRADGERKRQSELKLLMAEAVAEGIRESKRSTPD